MHTPILTLICMTESTDVRTRASLLPSYLAAALLCLDRRAHWSLTWAAPVLHFW
jgi:hypothetical protein